MITRQHIPPASIQRRRRERRIELGLEEAHEVRVSVSPGSHAMDEAALADLCRAAGLDPQAQRAALDWYGATYGASRRNAKRRA